MLILFNFEYFEAGLGRLLEVCRRLGLLGEFGHICSEARRMRFVGNRARHRSTVVGGFVISFRISLFRARFEGWICLQFVDATLETRIVPLLFVKRSCSFIRSVLVKRIEMIYILYSPSWRICVFSHAKSLSSDPDAQRGKTCNIIRKMIISRILIQINSKKVF